MGHNNTGAPVERFPEVTRPKLEGGRRFVMHSDFAPAGDQPTAIAELSQGVRDGERDQVLLGATGTGKTFTMA
ncbi:MAG: hypothetical protein KDJ19_15130, partial [Hyphomicrobiaceae bacterium]|nr:hypothetical protein [Hyphomicrobiaceae bacterium]